MDRESSQKLANALNSIASAITTSGVLIYLAIIMHGCMQ